MYKVLSVKLKPQIYKESEKIIAKLHMPRNRYMNDALHCYNAWNKRKLVQAKLRKESSSTAPDSLMILEEMDEMLIDA